MGKVEGFEDIKVKSDYSTCRNSWVSSTKMAAIVPLVIAGLWVALAVWDMMKILQ
jgi:hypothetical protein